MCNVKFVLVLLFNHFHTEYGPGEKPLGTETVCIRSIYMEKNKLGFRRLFIFFLVKNSVKIFGIQELCVLNSYFLHGDASFNSTGFTELEAESGVFTIGDYPEPPLAYPAPKNRHRTLCPPNPDVFIKICYFQILLFLIHLP